MRRNRTLVISLILLISLLGFMTVVFATRWGIGASPDSMVYVGAARNLADQRGFSLPSGDGSDSPLTHHAPLYSVLLSWAALADIDPGLAARWLNALLFGGNILLMGLYLGYLWRKFNIPSPWIPMAGALVIFSAPTLLELHLMAWTEPLFLLLGMAGIFLLGEYIQRSERRYLIGSALLVGLAFFTRYAGIALVATCGLAILLFSREPWRKRIMDITMFGLLSVAPMAVWMWRNLSLTGEATSRELYFHPISLSQVLQGFTTINSWVFVPDTAPTLVKGIVITSFVLGVGAIGYRRFWVMDKSGSESLKVNHQAVPIPVKIMSLFGAVYIGFLVVSISFYDANTPLDGRILSPLYIAALLLGLFSLAIWLSYKPSVFAKTLIILVLVGFIGANSLRSAGMVIDAYKDGLGFNSVSWLSSETLAEVRKLPENTVIYSNAPEVITFHTLRRAFGLPKKFESANQRENPAYQAELADLKIQILEKNGIVVYFQELKRPTVPSEQELFEVLPSGVQVQTSDGLIYHASSGN
ncbi:MAG TPA: hypothetical protein VLA49_13070 [Anaerolineales bacterium]|nr:hypothetical protein [Anaerolineales bacterium]